MRRCVLILLLCGVMPSLSGCGRSTGSAAPRVSITQVHFGDPADPNENTPPVKVGHWTPVYVDLKAGSEGLKPDEAQLVLETSDSDQLGNRFSVVIPPAQPNESFTVRTYARPGSARGEVTVSVQINRRNACPPFKRTLTTLEPDERLYWTAGSPLPNFPSLLRQREHQPKETIVTLTDSHYLPEHWFGYAAVDLLLLNTGQDRTFFEVLLNDKDPRAQRQRQALVEWIQRGGRLLLCVGRNPEILASFTELRAILPVALEGTMSLPAGHPRWRETTPGLVPLARSIKVARLEPRPGQPLTILLDFRAQVEPLAYPLIVQAAQGLGRVTVAAFDLDPEALSGGEGAAAFCQKLVQEASGGSPNPRDKGPVPRAPDGNLLTALQVNLENYGSEVRVISFGWVAMLIVLYILLIGPLDYLFLKKVLKRPELTWLSFPLVVVLVSLLAYFTAHSLKGDEQQINKVDMIDIDLAGQRVHGTSWFTIFSPPLQQYTIGLEPAAPSWAAPLGKDELAIPTVMSWMGRPEVRQPRGQSLFRRTYAYDTNNDSADPQLRGVPTGLQGVPIQAWSIKSFTARWQAPLDPTRPPLVAELQQRSARPTIISGTITSGLPIPLEDAVLLYGDDTEENGIAVHDLGLLPPDIPMRAEASLVGRNRRWLKPVASRAEPPSQSRSSSDNHPTTAELMKSLLFHAAAPGEALGSNRSLRYLDQTWRLRHDHGQVMIFGRLAPPVGPAEDLTQDPVSPTRLWLGAVPGRQLSRPVLSGRLRQETYVRVWVPLRQR